MPIFDNAAQLDGPRADAAWVMTASAVDRESFQRSGIADDCHVTPDASLLRFGEQLEIDRRAAGRIAVRVDRPAVSVELDIRPSGAISHFAHRPGLYDHWSVLCSYRGTFVLSSGERIEHAGSCTYEYARAVNLGVPVRFFTYQIINVDDATQVLLVEVLGPLGLPLQRSVYVREWITR